MRSANKAMISASSVSVFARRPVARAKSRIWRGIDHGERQASPGQGRGEGQLKAAGGLQHDQRRCQSAQLDGEPVEAFAIARNGEGLLRRQHMHIEAVL